MQLSCRTYRVRIIATLSVQHGHRCASFAQSDLRFHRYLSDPRVASEFILMSFRCGGGRWYDWDSGLRSDTETPINQRCEVY